MGNAVYDLVSRVRADGIAYLGKSLEKWRGTQTDYEPWF